MSFLGAIGAALIALVGPIVVAPLWLRWLPDDLRDRIADRVRSSATDRTPRVPPGSTLAFAEYPEELTRGIKDLAEHIEAVRRLAEERGLEVERFRDGYNYSITRSFARGVIKAIDMIADFQQQLDETHGNTESALLADAQKRFRATADQLELLLEANQIESFEPEIGDSVDAHSTRMNPVGVRAASTHDSVGCVAEVTKSGWRLVRGETDEVVIREAEVCVFGPAEEAN